MRLLPVVAAVTAAFLVVACSTPVPPRALPLSLTLMPDATLAPGMKSRVSITALKVVLKK